MTSFDFDVIGDTPRPAVQPAQKVPPEKAAAEKAQDETAAAPEAAKAADRAA